MIVALAGLSILACNKEEAIQEEETPSVDGYTYTIAVAGETKSFLDEDHMAWQTGDEIGWFTDQAGHSAINMGVDPRNFQVSSAAAMAAGAIIYAYAPYKAGDQSKTAAPLSIPTAQDGVISDAMPMVSLPITLESDMAAATNTTAGQASFINLGAVIEYNIYTTNAGYNAEKVQSVQFTATSSIAGDFSVDLTTVAENAIPTPSGLTEDTVISTLANVTTVGSSKANGIKVYQVIAPGTLSGTITVTTDAAVYTYPVSDKLFTRGKIKKLNADLASANATRIRRTEDLLTAHQWVLMGVKEVGTFVNTVAGNKLTLNSNYSMSFDCTAHGDKTYDYWAGGLMTPSTTGMSWAISEDAGKEYLTVTNGFLLVSIFTDSNTVYEIKELTQNTLIVDYYADYSWGGETWTLVFETADSYTSFNEYYHDIVSGDWGVDSSLPGTAYYLDSGLTNPDTLDGATWTWSVINNNNDAFDAGGYFTWATDWTFQIGSYWQKISDFILSSDSFPGTITRVAINFENEADTNFDISCKVGEIAFGSTVTNHVASPVVFYGIGSGDIAISFHSKGITPAWLYSISVDYLE